MTDLAPRIREARALGPLLDVELGALLDAIADAVADRVACRIAGPRRDHDPWLTSREAAAHLGIHVDTQLRLAAARKVLGEQEGAGCTWHFRLSELDRWRESGDYQPSTSRSRTSTKLSRSPEAR